MQYNKDEIKNSLTIEQVCDFVAEHGGEPIIKGDVLICRTICHNPAGSGSHKLYYYDNTKLFKCFTDCGGDAFDIFDLVCRIKKVQGEYKVKTREGKTVKSDWQIFDAVAYVSKFFNLFDFEFENINYENELPDWQIFEKYEENNESHEDQRVELKIFDTSILTHLPKPRIQPWEDEGITREVMLHRGIAYDPRAQAIVIPHYDIHGNLIGIRERTLVKEEEANGKYRPAILNYQMYNHPLSFNLYNLNNSKNQIKLMKKVIVFEGEKGPMLYASYFGEDNDITVACCGSSLIAYQVQLLMSLGVEEIIIAFDKQFKEIGDDEFKRWTKKLININKKYSKYATISFMFDKENKLKYKDSPIDRSKETFLELFNRRIFL